MSLTTAIVLLGAAPEQLVTIGTSALLYGPSFMALSGLLAVWSYRTFPEHLSTGFSATVLFLGLGTIAGPAALGAFADRHGLQSALLLTAGIVALTLLARPDRDGARGPTT